MKRFPLSALVAAVLIVGVTIALYSAVLGPLYQHGLWYVDMIVVIIAMALLLSGASGTIGITGKGSTQAIARWSVLRTWGTMLLILTVIHTIVCIVCQANLELFYWLLLGIIMAWYAVKYYFVDAGASIQEETERRLDASVANQRAVSGLLQAPTSMLIAAIGASGAGADNCRTATMALRSVTDKVAGLPVKQVERNAALVGEIGRWADRLNELRASIGSGASDAEIDRIAAEARSEHELINSLR